MKRLFIAITFFLLLGCGRAKYVEPVTGMEALTDATWGFAFNN